MKYKTQYAILEYRNHEPVPVVISTDKKKIEDIWNYMKHHGMASGKAYGSKCVKVSKLFFK